MSTLCDTEILALIKARGVIKHGSDQMLEGASYQLRLGNVYYDLSEGGARFELKKDEVALIKPGHRVVLITREELSIPGNILAKIVSKGSLFSIGLSPVATYADPGFCGNMGIVTQNMSDKYIVIPQDEPIAKIDFSRMDKEATRLYKGQHGFQEGIWPIKSHLQREYKSVKNDTRVSSEKEEALALLPNATRTIINRLEKTQLWTNISLFIGILLNASTLFLVSGRFIDSFLGLIGNLVASAIVGISILVINFFRRNT